jgi:hypothetical protein
MAAWPSRLTTTGVTAATPGVAATAAASFPVPASCPVPAGESGSFAAMITGASNPGPNPCAIVA